MMLRTVINYSTVELDEAKLLASEDNVDLDIDEREEAVLLGELDVDDTELREVFWQPMPDVDVQVQDTQILIQKKKKKSKEKKKSKKRKLSSVAVKVSENEVFTFREKDVEIPDFIQRYDYSDSSWFRPLSPPPITIPLNLKRPTPPPPAPLYPHRCEIEKIKPPVKEESSMTAASRGLIKNTSPHLVMEDMTAASRRHQPQISNILETLRRELATQDLKLVNEALKRAAEGFKAILNELRKEFKRAYGAGNRANGAAYFFWRIRVGEVTKELEQGWRAGGLSRRIPERLYNLYYF